MAPLTAAVQVRARSDIYAARRSARRLAGAMGFPPADVEAIVLAVSELGTNLLRYAPGGSLAVAPGKLAGRGGLRIESRDHGPGLGDVGRALSDGFSSGGGLGAGLGAVRRATDRLRVQSSPAGTRIVAWNWLSPLPS